MSKKQTKNLKESINLDIGLSVYDPKKMKNRYESYGVSYTVQKIFLICIAVVGGVIAFSAMYSLKPLYIVIVLLASMIFLPIYLLSIPKSKYQYKKLSEVSSYMKQMVQSMNDCKSIYPALVQTSTVFQEGEMKNTVDKAIEYIESEYGTEEAVIESLSIIEKKYPCEQLKRLHDFCIRAQNYGGEFEKELHLIDGFRKRWVERAQVYHKTLIKTANNSAIEYLALMFLCVVTLQILPEEYSIVNETSTQLITTALMIGFFVFALYMRNKTCANLLSEKRHMTEKEVEIAKNYIKNYKQSRSRKTAIKYGIVCLVVTTLAAFILEDMAIAVVGCVLAGVFFNMHNIILSKTKKQIKREVEEAFPRWLFDMCLLAQKRNISVAISESIASAPPILKKELEALEAELLIAPESKDAFLDFLKEYEMDNVADTMQMLYSLKIGMATGKQSQMQELISHNMLLLDKQDEYNDKTKRSMLAMYHFMPMLPAILVTLAYAVIMFITSFETLVDYVVW